MFGLANRQYLQFFADEHMICEHWFFYNWEHETVLYRRYSWSKEIYTIGVEFV